MSIHGFMDQNGQIQKYDYTDLENKPTIPAEVLIDDTLTEEGQAADAKAVGDAIDNIDPGLSQAAKQALLNIFQHVAYINADGQTYYDALEAALYPRAVYSVTNALTGCTTTNGATAIMEGDTYRATIIPSSGYTLDGASVTITMGGATVTGHYNNGQISIPNVTGNLVITVLASSAVTSVSAVFTQGQNKIYETDRLDVLRQYLVVTATYSDSTTAVVNDYTLSGTLTAGTSTITASYGGKTGAFTVTVTAAIKLANGTFVFSDGSTAAVNNNHVIVYMNTYNGNAGRFINLTDLAGNTSDIFDASNVNNKSSTLVSLSANDNLRIDIFNATADNTTWGPTGQGDIGVNIRKQNQSTSILSPAPTVYPGPSTPAHPTTTETYTLTTISESVVGSCVFVYVAIGYPAGATVEFDVRVAVE